MDSGPVFFSSVREPWCNRALGCPSLTGVLALSLTVFAVNSRTLLMTYYKVSIKQFSSCELQGSCGLKILVKVVAFLLTESKVSIMVATKLILVKEKHLQDPILMFNNVFMCLESNAKSCLKANLDKTL
ncbi:hypothetical protein KY285_009948 [Solanum tuberosum]|nr:hypothetical protein KY285_009948 [Solanum tuberosum]